MRRALHRLGFRWRRPRPVPPEKGSEEQQQRKRQRLEDVLQMVKSAGSFFQDETKLETNPKKVGFCWMRKGSHKPLPTPATNRKVWISGALNFKTGRFHWVAGERRNETSCSSSCSTGCEASTAATRSCTWRQTTTRQPHTSKRVEKKYVEEDSGGGIRLHPLPSWSAESNPVELVWWSLHEA
ncbi:MAG: transposase, partial [Rubrobacter sp.]